MSDARALPASRLPVVMLSLCFIMASRCRSASFVLVRSFVRSFTSSTLIAGASVFCLLPSSLVVKYRVAVSPLCTRTTRQVRAAAVRCLHKLRLLILCGLCACTEIISFNQRACAFTRSRAVFSPETETQSCHIYVAFGSFSFTSTYILVETT